MLQVRKLAGFVAFAAVCFGTSSAMAGAPPTAPNVSTGSATPLTQRTATVTGTLTSNGAPTTFSFEYGTTTGYGAQTPTRNAGPKASNLSISANLFGLTAGTVYHYALVATNSAGTTTGSDGTFTTAAAPAPRASTGAANGVTVRTAVLTGTVNAGGAATSFSFQYGLTPAYGAQTPTKNAGSGVSDRPVAASLSGLSTGTVYHYRIVATNSSGTTNGDDETFTTTAAPPPTVVTGSASLIRAKAALLTGTVTPNGAATTYEFQYGTTTGYGSQTTSHYAGAGSRGVTASGVISGLTPGQTYHFRLVATSSSGTTDGDDQSVTAPQAAPPAAATGAAGPAGAKSAKLAGTVTPNGSPTTYFFQYGTSTSYGSQTPTRNAGGGSKPVTIGAVATGLTPGTLYHYRLTATNSAGATSGDDATFTTKAAGSPHP